MSDSTTQPADAAIRSELKTIEGVVTSAKAAKTITVTVTYQTQHPKYGKYINRSTKFAVHDENGDAGEGDKVTFAECRPLSRHKHHRLVKVLEKAPENQ
jgi:small subunit ribosomal protein S17